MFRIPRLFDDACLFECATKRMDMYHPKYGVDFERVSDNFLYEHPMLKNYLFQRKLMKEILTNCSELFKHKNPICYKTLAVYQCFFMYYMHWFDAQGAGDVVCPINKTLSTALSRNDVWESPKPKIRTSAKPKVRTSKKSKPTNG